MSPYEKPPSRAELAEDVAARLRANGLDAVSDGENVTVREPAKTGAEDGGGRRKNILTVMGMTLAGIVTTLFGSRKR